MPEKPNETMNETHQPSRSLSYQTIKNMIAVFFLMILLGVGGYNYFQLICMDQSLLQTVAALQKTSDAHQQTFNHVWQTVQKTESISQQQSQMLNDWKLMQKGDLNKWQVMQVQSLVNLANDQLQLMQNTAVALSLLQRANQILNSLNDASLVDIKKSISDDITKLTTNASFDRMSLYSSLSAIDNQVDQLPFPATPLQAPHDQTAVADTTKMSWWEAGMHRSLEVLRKMIIVQYNGANTLPLVMPNERVYLYQNLHVQLESAMWGLLHHQATVYSESLARAQTWIKQYLDCNATSTKNVLNALQTATTVNVAPIAISLDSTIQALNRYIEQVK